MRSKKSKWIVIVACLVIFTGVTSCDILESNKLSPDQIVAVTSYADTLNNRLQAYQELADEITSTLVIGGVLDKDDLNKLAKINAEIDRITPEITAISAAVSAGQYSGDDPDIITILKAVRAGNRASGPWNPYAVIIEAGLGVVITVLGLFAKKKAKKVKIATGALSNVVAAVEISPDAKAIKSNVNNSDAEKALITKLKPTIVEAPVA